MDSNKLSDVSQNLSSTQQVCDNSQQYDQFDFIDSSIHRFQQPTQSPMNGIVQFNSMESNLNFFGGSNFDYCINNTNDDIFNQSGFKQYDLSPPPMFTTQFESSPSTKSCEFAYELPIIDISSSEPKFEPVITINQVEIPSDHVFEEAVREAPSELFLEPKVVADSSKEAAAVVKRQNKKKKKVLEKGTPEWEHHRASNKKAAQKHNIKKRRENEEKARRVFELEKENVMLTRRIVEIQSKIDTIRQCLISLKSHTSYNNSGINY